MKSSILPYVVQVFEVDVFLRLPHYYYVFPPPLS